MSLIVPYNEILVRAAARGLKLIGIWAVSELMEDSRRLGRAWEEGRLGSLNYLEPGRPSFSNPATLVSGAKTAVIFSIYYDRRTPVANEVGMAKVARYAWGKDYHLFFSSALKGLVGEIQELVEHPLRVRFGADAWPVLERAMATKAGLGFIGKNTMLIKPGEGSYSLLGAVIWDLELSDLPAKSVETGSCGTCTKCLTHCPTGAFVNPYELDARRCISYLTIEKRGPLTEQEGLLIGDWIFGCDVCQEVCPFNHASMRAGTEAEIECFRPEEGLGPLVDLKELFQIANDAEFAAKFSGTPLMRAKRQGLIRNGLWVARNQGATLLVKEIRNLTADLDSVISTTAKEVLGFLDP